MKPDDSSPIMPDAASGGNLSPLQRLLAAQDALAAIANDIAGMAFAADDASIARLASDLTVVVCDLHAAIERFLGPA